MFHVHMPWRLFSGSLLPKMGLFHVLKMSKKGWSRQVLAVEFGQLSVQWELFIKICVFRAVSLKHWELPLDASENGRGILNQPVSQVRASSESCALESVRMITLVPLLLICKFVVLVGQTYKGSSPWDFELNYHFSTWKPSILKTRPTGMLLFCFDSWLPLHFPGKALIPHSPLLILKVFSHSSLLGFEKHVVRSTNERYAAFKTAAAHFCICVK